ncbi:MAG: GYD domain-containing protein [Dehalococcoidia bacterium]
MVRYVVLYRFTEQGRRHLKETVHQSQTIREINETAGFNVIGIYYTQGQYDIVAVVEAPSEDAMLTGLFAIAEGGNVVSETLRAFTPEEMQRAVGP